MIATRLMFQGSLSDVADTSFRMPSKKAIKLKETINKDTQNETY
jgi:hypothetical protein